MSDRTAGWDSAQQARARHKEATVDENEHRSSAYSSIWSRRISAT